jgi:hypothetical protein
MSFEFSFTCKLTENNFSNITQPLEYECLYEYGTFSIDMKINSLSINFSSEIANVSITELQNFINKFRNFESCDISFNHNNGSTVEYKDNNISFNVYTYKEGTITDLDVSFLVDQNIHEKLIDIFTQLLSLKNRYDSIPIVGEDNYESSIENINSEEDENTQ